MYNYYLKQTMITYRLTHIGRLSIHYARCRFSDRHCIIWYLWI